LRNFSNYKKALNNETNFCCLLTFSRYIRGDQTQRFAEALAAFQSSLEGHHLQRRCILLQIFDIYRLLYEAFSRSAGEYITSLKHHARQKHINYLINCNYYYRYSILSGIFIFFTVLRVPQTHHCQNRGRLAQIIPAKSRLLCEWRAL
jgi:hypothetical protein